MHRRIDGSNIINLSKRSSDALISHRHCRIVPFQYRSISSTSQLQSSWISKIKSVFTGKSAEESQTPLNDFTLNRFADELSKARKVGSFKQYMVGRSSDATFSDSFERQEAIIRYLGGIDATGENLQTSHKQEAAKKCKCTIVEVENSLAKFTWAKEAQRKIESLQKEGKPLPKSFAEVQKIMGSTPMDYAKSNLVQSGQISRNAACPCGSNKRYKRCCGK